MVTHNKKDFRGVGNLGVKVISTRELLEKIS